jgi:hypothetical protein
VTPAGQESASLTSNRDVTTPFQGGSTGSEVGFEKMFRLYKLIHAQQMAVDTTSMGQVYLAKY